MTPRSDTVPEQPIAPAAIERVSAPAPSSARRRVARRAQKAEEAPKKSKAPLLAVVLVLGAGGAVAWKVTQKPVVVTVDPNLEVNKNLAVVFQDGKNLIKQGKWVDAKAKFAAVLEQQPDFAQGAVKNYLVACEKEIPNQQHFEEAAASLARGEVGPAHKALTAVSADTQQLARREELQIKLNDLFKLKVTEASGLAGALGDAAKMKKLKSIAEDLLVARSDDRDALEFKGTADRALHPRAKEVVEVPKDDPGLKVQQLFAGGDASGALKEAGACAAESETCRTFEAKLKELGGLLGRLESLGTPELETALKLDRAVAGGKTSPQGKPIATRIAAAYIPRASSARAKADWGLAMEYAQKVVDAEPGNPSGTAIVAEVKEKAHELYMRCYTQKDSAPDDAVQLCTEVVKILPPGDSQREKAERVIQALRAK